MVAMVSGRSVSQPGPSQPTLIVEESGQIWIEAAPLESDQVAVRVACGYCGHEITASGPPGMWLPVVCPRCRGEHMVRAAEPPQMGVCRRCEEGFCCGHCSCCTGREIEAEVDAYDVVTADGGEHRSLVDLVLAASPRLEIGSRVRYVGREVVEALPGELGTVIGVRDRGFADYYQIRWDAGSESWHWLASLTMLEGRS